LCIMWRVGCWERHGAYGKGEVERQKRGVGKRLVSGMVDRVWRYDTSILWMMHLSRTLSQCFPCRFRYNSKFKHKRYFMNFQLGSLMLPLLFKILLYETPLTGECKTTRWCYCTAADREYGMVS
jgi:hypothetical protein